jgi:type I site-specific restriction endonuclease
MPPLNEAGLWSAQVEAVTNLERSLADDRPRALIQMATGSGRTFTGAVWMPFHIVGAFICRPQFGRSAVD